MQLSQFFCYFLYLALLLCLCVHFSRSVESTLFPEFKDNNCVIEKFKDNNCVIEKFKDNNCVIENEKNCDSGSQYKQGMALCLSQSR